MDISWKTMNTYDGIISQDYYVYTRSTNMRSNKYRCIQCGMIIESEGTPDKKMGGPCVRESHGDHNWFSQRS